MGRSAATASGESVVPLGVTARGPLERPADELGGSVRRRLPAAPDRPQHGFRAAQSRRRPARTRRATSRNTSLPAGSPIAHPDPVAGERADHHPGSPPHAAANSTVRSPSASQTKLPCASGTSQPCSRSAATHPVRSATSAVDPLEQLGLPLQRRDRGRLGDRGDPERQRARADGRGDRLRRPRRSRPGTRPARRPWRTCASRPRWGGRGRSRTPSNGSSVRTNSR